jgi:hypothetical protein
MTDEVPIAIKESQLGWRYQLLEGPASKSRTGDATIKGVSIKSL